MHVPHVEHYMQQYVVSLLEKDVECKQWIFVKTGKLPIHAFLKLQMLAPYTFAFFEYSPRGLREGEEDG